MLFLEAPKPFFGRKVEQITFLPDETHNKIWAKMCFVKLEIQIVKCYEFD